MDKSMLSGGSIDAYIKCEFKKRKYKTEVHKYDCKSGKPIEFNQEFLLPA